MTILALLLAASTPPRVTEVVEPKARTVVVQAYIPAPPQMSDREAAAWSVLADALYDGSEEFSRDRLRDYATQAGEPLSIEAWPDFIKIQVTEPEGGMTVAALIVESLCLRASLTDEAVQQSVLRLRRRQLAPWSEALFDLDLPFAKVTTELVRNVYKNAFVPRSMSFVVGGAIEAGKGEAEIVKRFDVPAEFPPRRTRFDFAARQRLAHSANVATLEWRGAPMKPSDKDYVAKCLGVVALGVGKESALFRVAREAEGKTYRQEAVLWPTAQGWAPRFLCARTGEKDTSELTALREALLRDIETWDEGTLARTRAMLSSSREGWNPLSPFWTSLAGPMRDELADRCSLAGIEQLSGTPGIVLDSSATTLAELKDAASSLLEKAGVVLIPGRG
ncbi:MAG: insulinase family protein [Armatimonadetes bacterium]|nr:insulinase family protein [Armatimonadota bacterium]